MKVSDHVRGTSQFTYYRNGNLWYRTDTGFNFPVPLNDTDTATFNATFPSLTLMRWIRKRIEAGLNILDYQPQPWDAGLSFATFSHYRAGNLWYLDDGFEFPVPVEEIDLGCFEAKMPSNRLADWKQTHRQTLGRTEAC